MSKQWVTLAGLCAILASAGAAGAEFAPQVWVSPIILSYHFDRSLDLREDNVGPGVEVRLARDHAVMAGTFINSNRARTHYGAYQWRPLHWQPAGLEVGAGIVIGAFDGYPRMRDGGWFIGAMPVLAVEGRYVGANFTIVPTIKDRLDGAVAVQIKIRVW